MSKICANERKLANKRKNSRRAEIREILQRLLERGDIEPTGEIRNGQPAYRLTEQGMKRQAKDQKAL